MLTTEEFRPYAETLAENNVPCVDSLPLLVCSDCPLFSRCSTTGDAHETAIQWLKDHPTLEQCCISNAHKLASDHWDYINELLESHGVPAESRAICQFHYVSAFIHGYKHAEEEK